MILLMKKFPSWIQNTGIIIFIFVIVLILCMGRYIRYSETISIPIQIIQHNDSLVYGVALISEGIHNKIRIGQELNIKLDSYYSTQSKNIHGDISQIIKNDNNSNSDFFLFINLPKGNYTEQDVYGNDFPIVRASFDIIISQPTLVEKLKLDLFTTNF